jgi:hypothetical protein
MLTSLKSYSYALFRLTNAEKPKKTKDFLNSQPVAFFLL